MGLPLKSVVVGRVTKPECCTGNYGYQRTDLDGPVAVHHDGRGAAENVVQVAMATTELDEDVTCGRTACRWLSSHCFHLPKPYGAQGL